jgi:hypothetical protein
MQQVVKEHSVKALKQLEHDDGKKADVAHARANCHESDKL